ncbi:MAG: 50S ribosomal protein L27 [Candidatus Levybacteria bacterium CG_4_9_14_3_um_filter_35_16]|nr:MAG: 50S ribosomal protein L27 [Candidatus Levybacteria bacterium CG22_combo_CG10-13_8_21_14_all_35_11]PJA00853.1 MAG: 50S ribosomal protein L27 [Candidatus Levybacteria bacterium CG_4_10_14_0_2_um_filter_35_8]PJA90912.1 MAG: 50S ribosomal protein L27 [Candidatus Levybacteria bacterium CG_4_9_14_3_um_filter_35_16]PJC54584.1 MAG: 50S ribosomal protein L27 [Candidatus Levybacteria bacterium CG_4_9_14_0_2_um_filter_35_21]
MAHTKAQGSVRGNRDSKPKYLGLKIHDGQKVAPGNIIVRQKGTKLYPGKGVSMGKDYTIFSVVDGVVKIKNLRGKKIVEVSAFASNVARASAV